MSTSHALSDDSRANADDRGSSPSPLMDGQMRANTNPVGAAPESLMRSEVRKALRALELLPSSASTPAKRSAVFETLAELGVAEVSIDFSGGNDEGGADDTTFTGSDGTELQLTLDCSDPLSEALEEPLYDEYGGFAGDFEVSGTLTWNVAERTLVLSGAETEWVEFEREV